MTSSTADTPKPMRDAAKSPLPIRFGLPAPIFCPTYGAIVCPSASIGQDTKLPSLFAAVTPATTVDPKPFTAAWITSVPIAVIEYCIPIGIPIAHKRIIYFGNGFHSSFVPRRIGKCFPIYHRQHNPEIPCASTVASAAPLTPIRNTMINTRSSPILRTDANAKKITGVLLSPKERISAANILYRKVHGIPKKMINIYQYV